MKPIHFVQLASPVAARSIGTIRKYCLLLVAALLVSTASQADHTVNPAVPLVTSSLATQTLASSTAVVSPAISSPAISSTTISTKKVASTPVVLVLGDSLSVSYGIDPGLGWVSLLDNWLGQREQGYRAVNISISGETTNGGLQRLPAALRRWDPAVVIIALGGNDGLRATPLQLVEKNLNQIIALCRAHGARMVLAGMRIPPNYGPRYADAFFALYANLAKQHALALVPFLLEGIAGEPELMQDDGLHPRVSAQARIVENIKPVLSAVLAGKV